ncbi:MAG TPA: hypothetical protein PKA98_13890 [Acidimicrobiales bacterium]|nr:hypothetical protein [Acidimicrobiales bacterium]
MSKQLLGAVRDAIGDDDRRRASPGQVLGNVSRGGGGDDGLRLDDQSRCTDLDHGVRTAVIDAPSLDAPSLDAEGMEGIDECVDCRSFERLSGDLPQAQGITAFYILVHKNTEQNKEGAYVPDDRGGRHRGREVTVRPTSLAVRRGIGGWHRRRFGVASMVGVDDVDRVDLGVGALRRGAGPGAA